MNSGGIAKRGHPKFILKDEGLRARTLLFGVVFRVSPYNEEVQKWDP